MSLVLRAGFEPTSRVVSPAYTPSRQEALPLSYRSIKPRFRGGISIRSPLRHVYVRPIKPFGYIISSYVLWKISGLQGYCSPFTPVMM